MSYQTSSKLSRSFWLLISARKLCVFLPSQKAERPMEQGGGGRRKEQEVKILKGWEAREIGKVT